MAGIKAKISNLLHKDKDHPHDHTTGTDDYGTGSGTGTASKTGTGLGTTTGTGTGLGSTTGTGTGTGTGLSSGSTGYDSTRGEQDTRTGMSNLDINKGSTGTGLRSDRDTGLTGSEYGQTSTTGTGYGTTGTGYGTTGDVSQGVTRSYDNTTNEIIDQERFTKTEDHEVVIEKKAYELEHRPVEKKYVVETKYMGEREVGGKPTEILGTEAREVEERVVEMPRGDRTIIVENVDVPVGLESAGRAINEHGTTGYSSTTTGQTGTGYGSGTTGQTSTGYGSGTTGQTGTGYGTGQTGTSSGYGTGTTGQTGTGYGESGTSGTGYGSSGTGTGTGGLGSSTAGQQGGYGSDNRTL